MNSKPIKASERMKSNSECIHKMLASNLCNKWRIVTHSRQFFFFFKAKNWTIELEFAQNLLESLSVSLMKNKYLSWCIQHTFHSLYSFVCNRQYWTHEWPMTNWWLNFSSAGMLTIQYGSALYDTHLTDENWCYYI